MEANSSNRIAGFSSSTDSDADAGAVPDNTTGQTERVTGKKTRTRKHKQQGPSRRSRRQQKEEAESQNDIINNFLQVQP